MSGPFIARAQWATVHPNWTPLNLPTPEGWQHHTGGDGPGRDLVGYLRGLEHYEMTRGDGQIALAYHRLVVSGGPWDGARVEVRPWGMQGGATYRHNSTSHALVITGNFEGAKPTKAALDSAAEEWAYAIRHGFVAAGALIDSHSKASSNSTACAGANLISRLPDLRNAIAKKLGKAGPVVPPTPGDPHAPPAQHPTLRRGSKGPSVVHWQALLNLTTGAGLAVDGDFGPRTETATEAFQRFWHLQADGIVGPQTWGAMAFTLTVQHRPEAA